MWKLLMGSSRLVLYGVEREGRSNNCITGRSRGGNRRAVVRAG